MNEGDWICSDPQCNNVNFARRTSCNRCGIGMSSAEKASTPQRKKLGHEIGKAAAEKSRGLFSADDWQCGRCGNVNWARRQQCNMCNAPKFGEVEERTGLGGGYNERESVEYVERDESDGEYDDFGRKKKKFRGNEDAPENEMKRDLPQVETKSAASKPTEDDEEEEDEDDEDGDLSKYDLSGWGDDDDDDNGDDQAPKKNHNRKSRSRSQSSASSGSSGSAHSRSSSYSSRSSSASSSDSGKPARTKRTNSRSRSSSSAENGHAKRRRSMSPVIANNSRSADRSESNSPASQKH